jgi:hypothetical protein
MARGVPAIAEQLTSLCAADRHNIELPPREAEHANIEINT